jgi:uncharacterized phage protein (predicted DNA packaging)
MADAEWTEILTLAEVKTHLRVGSDTSEDSLITTYITAAREYVEGYQNRIYLSTDEEVTAETMTGVEKAACLLLIGHWYENRQAVVLGTPPSEVPFAVKALLDIRRKVPV